MGRIDDSDPARAFAESAAQLASEAVLLVQYLEPDGSPNVFASRALQLAQEAAEELEQIALEGGDLRSAYLAATTALESAASALAEARKVARPWVYHVRPTRMRFPEVQ